MLAKLARELPHGDYLYEPKWDGFRALVFRDGGEVDIRSRNDRPLARYFPEIVAAVLALPEADRSRRRARRLRRLPCAAGAAAPRALARRGAAHEDARVVRRVRPRRARR
jgi:ATP-dependent DNA ligase